MIVSVSGERCAYFAGLAYFEDDLDLGELIWRDCVFFDVDVPLGLVSVEERRF